MATLPNTGRVGSRLRGDNFGRKGKDEKIKKERVKDLEYKLR